MEPHLIDQVRLNFNPQTLTIIKIAIAFMMLGVALEIRLEDFKKILMAPKAPAIGLVSQFILLPAFTFLLILAVDPRPSIALGMIMVAACPGGNLSNIITYLARGNNAVSVSMTGVSTGFSLFMTPLNLAFWGSLNPSTAPILRTIQLSPIDVFVTVIIILGIPVTLGMTLSRLFPGLADKIRKPFRILSFVFFVAVVIGALMANWQYFLEYVGYVVFFVFLHNLLAMGIGYSAGRLLSLDGPDVRAVTIEVGIQNSGLGLVLTLNFFAGLGGMAILVAWWGIWHIIAGLAAAMIFTRGEIFFSGKNEAVSQGNQRG
jgi:BASS family bile acid:Na+ symporter